MNKKLAIHFGAGALGRGLVVPLLYQSGYDIVCVDTNEALNQELNKTRSYIVDISDEIQENRNQEIKIVEAISPSTDREKLNVYLNQASIVTTSVRRENLIHVARTLVNTWGSFDGDNRLVICCENIEKVGKYFKNLLLNIAETEDQLEKIERIQVPDTIVDRICAAAWPESTVVTSEMFHECAVDAKIVLDTGIGLIPAVRNIEMDFSRKRFLLNTYADAISFIALGKGKNYLYEAAESAEINQIVAPYLSLLKKMLELEYGCDQDELDIWQAKYKKRLCNRNIPRKLDTVARNLWNKLTLDERFVYPLVKLLDYDSDISQGVSFIAELIRVGVKFDGNKYSPEELKVKLKDIWCETPKGSTIYELILKFL